MTTFAPTRRGFLASAAVVGAAASLPPPSGAPPPPPVPPRRSSSPRPPRCFKDFGTNAEMLWSSVDPKAYLTPQSRLFVRNHTKTPTIDRSTYALKVYGDGLATSRTEADALTLSFADLQRLPHHDLTAVVECTGNGRSLFTTQQGQSVSGTAWTLGAVGTVRWSGVRLRDVLAAVGLSPDAVSIQATGLDDPFVSGGTDHGRVRRPFPVEKALDDALLAWGMNGEDLLPDHGYPLRLVLPGWVGIASIKWLGSLEVSTTRAHLAVEHHLLPDDRPAVARRLPAADRQPGALRVGARQGRRCFRHDRSPSPAARGAVPARSPRSPSASTAASRGGPPSSTGAVAQDQGWTQWSVRWGNPRPGRHELLARATDDQGRTQPFEAAYNTQGYFFDAVVRHPVQVA